MYSSMRTHFLILLYMCPHTTTYVFSFYYICVLILGYMCAHTSVYGCCLVKPLAGDLLLSLSEKEFEGVVENTKKHLHAPPHAAQTKERVAVALWTRDASHVLPLSVQVEGLPEQLLVDVYPSSRKASYTSTLRPHTLLT